MKYTKGFPKADRVTKVFPNTKKKDAESSKKKKEKEKSHPTISQRGSSELPK